MGLTYQQAVSLGIGALHPAVSGGKSKERELLDSIYAAEARPSKAPDDGLNKTERAFRDDVLEPAWVRGTIEEYLVHAVKIKLAGKTFYTPEFMVIEKAGEHGLARLTTIVEIKGHMRDDAAVKIKVAANQFSFWRWLLVRRDGRHGWDVREVNSSGIGTVSRLVPWIHGKGC